MHRKVNGASKGKENMKSPNAGSHGREVVSGERTAAPAGASTGLKTAIQGYKEYTKLRDKITATETQFAEKDARITELETKSRSNIAQIKKLESESAEKDTRIKTTLSTVNMFSKLYKQSEDDMRRSHKRQLGELRKSYLGELRKGLAEKGNRIANLKARFMELKSESAEKNARITKLENEKSALIAEHKTQTAQIKSESAEKDARIATLAADNEDLKSKRDDPTAAARHRRQDSETKRKFVALKAEIAKLHADLEKVEKKYAELKKKKREESISREAQHETKRLKFEAWLADMQTHFRGARHFWTTPGAKVPSSSRKTKRRRV